MLEGILVAGAGFEGRGAGFEECGFEGLLIFEGDGRWEGVVTWEVDF